MELDFEKMNGLIPAIIQDNSTQKVLMLGFMNQEAYQKTVETGKVTFFSRTRNRLWTKGEESGNFLHVVSIKADCDNDTLLIMVNPVGPVCHTGTDTCWGDKLHRQALRRDAGRLVHHQPVQVGREQDGPESGRRSRRNRHRGVQRYRRTPDLRRLGPAVSPHRPADLERIPHRRPGPRAERTPQPILEKTLITDGRASTYFV